ncbi:hypothetical protein JCM25156A_11040 [Komagataeibacter kakiaceti JCM 25156]|uniref:hypothetical protein n=1 Tax=Komagataeibacter kakiaceti TaxID=943261 RepID=UPI0004711955|nr:hypothetical protein [Komagataeibacter kakiaceti]
MPFIRALPAGLCLGMGLVMAASCAHARSHHFEVHQRHPHTNSPYGYIRNYEPAYDRQDPRYISATQRCETQSSIGALYNGSGNSTQVAAGSSHKKYFAVCMVEAGAWKAHYESNVGGRIDQ